jgi:hypothetical protein
MIIIITGLVPIFLGINQEVDAARLISSENIKIFQNDWYIDSYDHVEMSNQTIILDGNLIINSSGILSLYNTTVILNNTPSKPLKILIKQNGSLNAKRSVITANSNQSVSMVFFEKNSYGNLLDTKLIAIGYKPLNSDPCNPIHAAIIANTNNLVIENCIIKDSEIGLFMNHSSPIILNIQIQNCTFGIKGKNSQSKLINCSFITNETDIILNASSNITAIDSDIENPKLDETSKLMVKNNLCIQVWFKTPFLKPVDNAEALVETNGLPVYSTPGFGGNQRGTDENGIIDSILVAQTLYSGNNITNFKSNISVKHKTRLEIERSIEKTSSGTEYFYFDNHLPNLFQPSVTPWTGNTKTNFCYKIIYSDEDNDRPGKVQVEIDNNNIYNLSLLNPSTDIDNISWKNGSWFKFNITLSEGEHKFRFITNDDLGFDDIFAPTGKIESLNGPDVVLKNSEPILSKGAVSPKEGNSNTLFNFRIKYWDNEGDIPVIAKVYINNIPYNLMASKLDDQDEIASLGIWFELEIKLPIGQHDFYFKFKDDDSEIIQWPNDDSGHSSIDGPIVRPFKNKKPIIGNGTVGPSIGNRDTIFSFIISYFDAEGDLPTAALIIIDDQQFNLSRARIAQDLYFYEGSLPLGEHYFHFEFKDEMNQHFIRYPTQLGTEIFGPIVIDVPPQIQSGKVTPTSGTIDTIYNFTIFYQDIENDLPVQAQVVIDNKTFDLEKVQNSNNFDDVSDSSSPTSQSNNTRLLENENESWQDEQDEQSHQNIQNTSFMLQYSTMLDLGEHSFYFLITSGTYLIRYPHNGYLSGPLVLKAIKPKQNQPKDHQTNSKDSKKNTSEKEDDDTNLTVNNNENNCTNEPELATSELYLIIINYSVNNIEGFPNNVFQFKLICQVPLELKDDYKCWVYVDEEPIIMNLRTYTEKDILIFETILELTSGEHYYHFLLNSGGSNARLPYKGEIGIVVVKDKSDAEESAGNTLFDRFNVGQKNEIFKAMFIVLLILAVLYFSFYRKYLELRRKSGQ